MIRDPDLWAALPHPAMVVDADGRVTALNSAGESALNLSARRVEGKPIMELLDLDEDVRAAWRRAVRDRSPLTVAGVELRPHNGTPITGTLDCAPLGSRMLMVLSLRSGRFPDRPHNAARAAIGMAEMLAHEIKNPLAGITGAAQLLSMSLEPADQELTDLIVGECRRITALLGQVEQFGDLQPPKRNATNLHDVLDRARQSAALGFGGHMTFVEDYDPSLPEAFVDADQLLQVVLNLVKNASEANPEGGKITLHSYYDASLRHRDAEGKDTPLPLQVEIIDNGPGLPPEIADQIFDPFVSGRENGTGLGLALVSKLMRDNGAMVGVESAPGRTVFRLSLPRFKES